MPHQATQISYQHFFEKSYSLAIKLVLQNRFHGLSFTIVRLLSGKKFWKMNFPGQGKVRELHFQSGKFKKNEKVMEKSGNFKIFLQRC